MTEYFTARQNMVDGQIKPNRVVDERVLDAFRTTPRERFVQPAQRGVAYVDEDIPLGRGRFLTEPRVLGRLITEARIGPDDRVLDIGPATGYSTAILSQLASSVVAVEQDDAYREQAQALLRDLQANNVSVIGGSLTAGCPDQAPFDVILIAGSVATPPVQLFEQLGEYGRLMTIIRQPRRTGRAALFGKVGGVVSHRELFDAASPYMPGFEPKPAFQF